MSNEELQKLVESNAKSIQALTHAIAADREELKQFKREWRQDRRQIFEWMSRIFTRLKQTTTIYSKK
jgi:hypothetical protein